MSSLKVSTRILIISDTHGAQPYVKPSTTTTTTTISNITTSNSNSSNQPDTEDELTSPTANLLHAPTGFRDPLPSADVAIHCGDLTRRSTPAEFAATFAFLSALRAPLKLAIAGNHDLALDAEHWFEGYEDDDDDGDAADLYGGGHHEWAAEARRKRREERQAVLDIVARAEAHGVRYLTEGTHSFALGNGARLSVYASPYTPVFGGWAFQYPPGAHDFRIPSGVDVAVTHGPPLGVLDGAGMAQLQGLPPDHPATDRAGCDALFQAVHAARPQLHCFGHIHEAWGGYLATWRDDDGHNDGQALPDTHQHQHHHHHQHQHHHHRHPTWHSAIDPSTSQLLYTARHLKPQTRADLASVTPEAVRRLARLSRQRCVHVDTTGADGEATRLEKGRQTLFVNASIMDVRYRPSQLPWLVDLELPRAEAQP